MIAPPVALILLATAPFGGDPTTFAHWETPQVHPLELSADGLKLLAVNTADARLMIFDTSGALPVQVAEVPVGLDPVSVRLRGADRAWVVNHTSDSISIVDLPSARVIATLRTADEPCDVVFAGSPLRAFVTCSQANLVQVFDPAQLALPPIDVPLRGEDPRALAVSLGGGTVYAAIFESGNGTTVLGGGLNLGGTGTYPPNAVSDMGGPWGGMNPPPNAGAAFSPAMTPGLPAAPEVGLIVRRDAQGNWFDDNLGDWTRYVTGDRAPRSGRRMGWDLLDHDVAAIDVATLGVSYHDHLMTSCMALAVHPVDGRIALVGSEAQNERRFEPLLNGAFVTMDLALVDPSGVQATVVRELNPHLDYSMPTLPMIERERSIGDPRGLLWSTDGSTGWVSGRGSNNLISIDTSGARSGAPIELEEGPTGLALDDGRGRLYVLQRFAASIGLVDVASRTLVGSTPFYDPTPEVIRLGRPFLYDTHRSSGTGHVACGSCHLDARTDRLAWDLGDPSGAVVPFDQNCRDSSCADWHPMKGPMLTQTLQDIVGKEPHHWRGDRSGIEAFNPAFQSLLGDDTQLDVQEMQAFEDFLATVRFPPNPFRDLDNSLPTDLALPGHYRTGRFGPAGMSLPDGNAVRGLALYRPPNMMDGVACANCHTLPTGMGSDTRLTAAGVFVPIPAGPLGEHHHPVTSGDGSSQLHFKIPQLRNLYERVGHDATQLESTAGFGFLHDGSVDSLARFVAEPVFQVQSDQDVADFVAFLLSFSGSDLPLGSPTNIAEPPGTLSFDTHAAVGAQVTLVDAGTAPLEDLDRITLFEQLAAADAIGLVVHGWIAGESRGLTYQGGRYASDRVRESYTPAGLLAQAAPGSELTWTVVVHSTAWRMGVDRDLDGARDRDERDAGSDPLDPGDRPLGVRYCSPAAPNSSTHAGVMYATGNDLVAEGRFRLYATRLPAHSFGYFLGSRQAGLVPFVGGGSGHLCLGGQIGRFVADVRNSGIQGAFEIDVDLAGLPQPNGLVAALVGETWRFQAWHRDLGPTTNLTDAVRVTFR